VPLRLSWRATILAVLVLTAVAYVMILPVLLVKSDMKLERAALKLLDASSSKNLISTPQITVSTAIISKDFT